MQTPSCKSGSRCRLQYNSPVPFLLSISKTFYKIWSFEEICLKTYGCNMVSPWWRMQELVRIHGTKRSTQDPSPNPTNQVLCFWRPHKSNHLIVLCSIISSRLGIVQLTVPNKTPVNFPLRIYAIAHNKTVTFSQHQEDGPQNSHNRDNAPKSIIKQPSQDHQSTDILQQDHFLPFQDHKSSTAPFSGP